MPPRTVLTALAVACLFLAGSVGYVIGVRTTAPSSPSEADTGFLIDMIAHRRSVWFG